MLRSLFSLRSVFKQISKKLPVGRFIGCIKECRLVITFTSCKRQHYESGLCPARVSSITGGSRPRIFFPFMRSAHVDDRCSPACVCSKQTAAGVSVNIKGVPRVSEGFFPGDTGLIPCQFRAAIVENVPICTGLFCVDQGGGGARHFLEGPKLKLNGGPGTRYKHLTVLLKCQNGTRIRSSLNLTGFLQKV